MRRLRARAAIFLLCWAVVTTVRPAAASARKKHQARPKSHHLKRAASKSAEPAEPSEPPIERILGPGRWDQRVRDALDRVMQSRGSASPDYSASDPPVALFVWEDVAVTHTMGDALFARLVREAGFRFGPEFWRLFPAQYGRDRARAAYEAFRAQPRQAWAKDPYYAIYRKTFLKALQTMCREWGGTRCVHWRDQLLTGFTEAEMRRYAADVLTEELQRPVGFEEIPEYAGDPSPARETTGLRRIPEMEDLFLKLRERGFDVWVLCSANQLAAEEFAKEYGVHPSRVVGLRAKLAEEKLTPDILLPIPAGAGMEEAVTMFIGRPPALIVGGATDAGLLSYGRGIRIMLVDPKDAASHVSRAWLLQPRFSPSREPQERAAPATARPTP